MRRRRRISSSGCSRSLSKRELSCQPVAVWMIAIKQWQGAAASATAGTAGATAGATATAVTAGAIIGASAVGIGPAVLVGVAAIGVAAIGASAVGPAVLVGAAIGPAGAISGARPSRTVVCSQEPGKSQKWPRIILNKILRNTTKGPPD